MSNISKVRSTVNNAKSTTTPKHLQFSYRDARLSIKSRPPYLNSIAFIVVENLDKCFISIASSRPAATNSTDILSAQISRLIVLQRFSISLVRSAPHHHHLSVLHKKHTLSPPYVTSGKPFPQLTPLCTSQQTV